MNGVTGTVLPAVTGTLTGVTGTLTPPLSTGGGCLWYQRAAALACPPPGHRVRLALVARERPPRFTPRVRARPVTAALGAGLHSLSVPATNTVGGSAPAQRPRRLADRPLGQAAARTAAAQVAVAPAGIAGAGCTAAPRPR